MVVDTRAAEGTAAGVDSRASRRSGQLRNASPAFQSLVSTPRFQSSTEKIEFGGPAGRPPGVTSTQVMRPTTSHAWNLGWGGEVPRDIKQSIVNRCPKLKSAIQGASVLPDFFSKPASLALLRTPKHKMIMQASVIFLANVRGKNSGFRSFGGNFVQAWR
jgi:hypothetical protein